MADTLSRVEAVEKTVNYETLAQAQEEDTELQEILKTERGLKLTKIPFPGTIGLYCDTDTPITRPYVPYVGTLRRQIFLSLHNLAHPSIKATVKLITQRYVWPHAQRDYTFPHW